MTLTPQQIKAHRKQHGLTQKALADKAGVSTQKVRLRWEQEGIPDKDIREAFVIVGMVSNLELKAGESGQ